jgi:hypothetical protein
MLSIRPTRLAAWRVVVGDYYGDAVAADRAGIERRLVDTGWLEVDRHGPQEIAVRPGPPLLDPHREAHRGR